MCRLPTPERYLQFGLNNYDCSSYDLGGGGTGGWAGRGRAWRPSPGLAAGAWCLNTDEKKKIHRKTGKDFPIPPPQPWLFMIIHIFKWKGKKAKKETLKWAKKEKKISEKNFRGKSCSILKSFEGCKVPRFHTFSVLFFSDFFSMFNICEMTAFLYLKLDASGFVGRGWWYSRFFLTEKVYA